MTVQERKRVRVTRRFEHSAERVFDAWIDPAIAKRWLFATPSGEMVRCELDPRPGGRFTIVERRDGEDIAHVGEYVEVDRPRRLVFTFAVPKFSAEKTKVTIEIVPKGKGSELTLIHEQVLPDWASRTEQGWTMLLGSLERTIAG